MLCHRITGKMADLSHLSIVAGLFVMIFLSWKDLSGTETSSNIPNIQKEIKTPKMAQLATPTLKFLFWYAVFFLYLDSSFFL